MTEAEATRTGLAKREAIERLKGLYFETSTYYVDAVRTGKVDAPYLKRVLDTLEIAKAALEADSPPTATDDYQRGYEDGMIDSMKQGKGVASEALSALKVILNERGKKQTLISILWLIHKIEALESKAAIEDEGKQGGHERDPRQEDSRAVSSPDSAKAMTALKEKVETRLAKCKTYTNYGAFRDIIMQEIQAAEIDALTSCNGFLPKESCQWG